MQEFETDGILKWLKELLQIGDCAHEKSPSVDQSTCIDYICCLRFGMSKDNFSISETHDEILFFTNSSIKDADPNAAPRYRCPWVVISIPVFWNCSFLQIDAQV